MRLLALPVIATQWVFILLRFVIMLGATLATAWLDVVDCWLFHQRLKLDDSESLRFCKPPRP